MRSPSSKGRADGPGAPLSPQRPAFSSRGDERDEGFLPPPAHGQRRTRAIWVAAREAPGLGAAVAPWSLGSSPLSDAVGFAASPSRGGARRNQLNENLPRGRRNGSKRPQKCLLPSAGFAAERRLTRKQMPNRKPKNACLTFSSRPPAPPPLVLATCSCAEPTTLRMPWSESGRKRQAQYKSPLCPARQSHEAALLIRAPALVVRINLVLDSDELESEYRSQKRAR